MMPGMRIGTAVALLLLSTSLVLVGRSSAAFPGDNGKIAWASARNANFEIYSAKPDGSELSRLTTDPGADKDPAWSEDGTHIAFQSNRSGNDDIYVMSVDGSGQTRLTTSPGNDVNPAWGPSASRSIVFASNRDGDAEIWVMNEDGSNQTQLTKNDGASDAVPAWSPDGTKIAFTSTRDGNAEIYVMNVDGSSQTRLTNDPGSDISPNWSPDGKQIAFASDRTGTYEIYVMNADGTDQRRLTTNLESDIDPAWSPDGKQLVFTSNRDGNNEIYVMNADGSAQTRFTAAVGDDTTSDWQALPIVQPPPQPLKSAVLTPSWRESRYLGSLVVRGSVPGPSRLRLVLRRANAVHFTARLSLASGPFTRQLRMPRDLLPGAYILDVTAPGSPTPLTSQVLSPTLRPPPEGVVSRAWVSDVIDGPPVDRFPSTTERIWAHFQFAALPKSGRGLTATWYGPAQVEGPKPKPRSRLVISYVNVTNGVPLPRGVWRCVLRAGPTVVTRVATRIG
jgi:Tol biopolymer transport system component